MCAGDGGTKINPGCGLDFQTETLPSVTPPSKTVFSESAGYEILTLTPPSSIESSEYVVGALDSPIVTGDLNHAAPVFF